MRIWLSKNSDVTLRDQLVTQVILGIVSNDLTPGQKLPSTRELARRFQIHSNTVSAAYRELERRGWVGSRKGSGVYVSERNAKAPANKELELDQIISSLFKLARERGYSLSDIQSRVRSWLQIQPPDHFLLIEPDDELRRILSVEITDATSMPVVETSLEGCSDSALFDGAAPLAMYGRAEAVRAKLPGEIECTLLHYGSVVESLQGHQRPSPDSLIAVASSWPEFLRWAHTILAAVGLDSASVNFHDARVQGWEKGLRSSTFVITDTLTARRVPSACDVRVFRIIADSSIAELRKFVA